MQPSPNPPTKTILIGLSGPSSSGKTTLARHLRTIFNLPPNLSLSIIHLDDFYKTDALIPQKTFHSSEHGTRTLQDWDCVESLDLGLLEETLVHVSRTGNLPDDLVSKEDQNSVGESSVSEDEVDGVRTEIQNWMDHLIKSSGHSQNHRLKIWIIDGFLLFPDPSLTQSDRNISKENSSMSHSGRSSQENELLSHLRTILQPLLTLKLFLPCSKNQTITRRNARSGYVTLEGFWTDPPGYVEDVVWPNYIKDHAWMFQRRPSNSGKGSSELTEDEPSGAKQDFDLEGFDETEFNQGIVSKEGIEIAPGKGTIGMKELIDWATERIKDVVQKEIY